MHEERVAYSERLPNWVGTFEYVQRPGVYKCLFESMRFPGTFSWVTHNGEGRLPFLCKTEDVYLEATLDEWIEKGVLKLVRGKMPRDYMEEKSDRNKTSIRNRMDPSTLNECVDTLFRLQE